MEGIGNIKFLIALANCAIREAEEAISDGVEDVAYRSLEYAVDMLSEAMKHI